MNGAGLPRRFLQREHGAAATGGVAINFWCRGRFTPQADAEGWLAAFVADLQSQV
jgi:hypothetical protein